MDKFIIFGGEPLKGEICVRGAKNAATPIIAASLLVSEECRIQNVPRIKDVEVLIEILKDLGAEIKWSKSELKIRCKNIDPSKLSEEKVTKFRSSILLVGPLLARFHKIKIPHPGGCIIGARPIDAHLDALTPFGVKITQEKNHFLLEANKIKGSQIILREFSVTATENAMMAAVLAFGETKIEIAACEPHVKDLADFLNKMGAKIDGAGTHSIKIKGVKKLHSASYKIIPDPIEAGTFAILAAATKSNVKIKNVIPEHLNLFLKKLQEMNVQFKIGKDYLQIKPSTLLKATKIQALPYPGIPTDLQAPFAVLATQCQGTSLIHDPMYENRLKYIEELNKMGANAVICDPHRALISGPTSLFGQEIKSFDIRAGATLVIAALVAAGKSEISDIYQIDRGYEFLDQRLRKLGAKIKRVSK